jgi:cysteine desulfurase
MNIYLDNSATTKVKDKVMKEMQKYFLEDYGNPSSQHKLGENALKAITKAREQIAKEINAKPQEIYFTSGATESNNLALQGLVKANQDKKKIIISSIEHPSISETCNYLQENGYKISRIPVDAQGHIRLDILKREIDSNTLLVSIMHVNNIFGTIQDLEKIGEICKEKNSPFHTDAVQSLGKLNIDVQKQNISLLSASAHKIGGPKGIGFLYVKENTNIEPLFYGGGQEKNIRSGTENVPGIMGFAKAIELQKKVKKDKIEKLRDKLIDNLIKLGGKINGSLQNRIYNNINVSFILIDSETLIQYLSSRGFYISSGSACESKREKEEQALKALGLNGVEIKGSIRIVLNEDTTEKDIQVLTNEIKKAIKKISIN